MTGTIKAANSIDDVFTKAGYQNEQATKFKDLLGAKGADQALDLYNNNDSVKATQTLLKSGGLDDKTKQGLEQHLQFLAIGAISFAGLDKNHDGKIKGDEAKAAAKHKDGLLILQEADRIKPINDSITKDGTTDAAEWEKYLKDNGLNLDRQKALGSDGKLDMNELQNLPLDASGNLTPLGLAMIKMLADKDGDGKLSDEEKAAFFAPPAASPTPSDTPMAAPAPAPAPAPIAEDLRNDIVRAITDGLTGSSPSPSPSPSPSGGEGGGSTPSPSPGSSSTGGTPSVQVNDRGKPAEGYNKDTGFNVKPADAKGSDTKGSDTHGSGNTKPKDKDTKSGGTGKLSGAFAASPSDQYVGKGSVAGSKETKKQIADAVKAFYTDPKTKDIAKTMSQEEATQMLTAMGSFEAKFGTGKLDNSDGSDGGIKKKGTPSECFGIFNINKASAESINADPKAMGDSPEAARGADAVKAGVNGVLGLILHHQKAGHTDPVGAFMAEHRGGETGLAEFNAGFKNGDTHGVKKYMNVVKGIMNAYKNDPAAMTNDTQYWSELGAV